MKPLKIEKQLRNAKQDNPHTEVRELHAAPPKLELIPAEGFQPMPKRRFKSSQQQRLHSSPQLHKGKNLPKIPQQPFSLPRSGATDDEDNPPSLGLGSPLFRSTPSALLPAPNLQLQTLMLRIQGSQPRHQNPPPPP